MDVLTEVVSELLKEDKKQHLQTYGYVLEKTTAASPGESQATSENTILDKFSSGFSVKQMHINLNKQTMVTRNWERVYLMLGDHVFKHFYKNYLIFLKTRDDSLV